MSERPLFSSMPTNQFVAHLERHGLTPTNSELQEIQGEGRELRSRIETSILEGTGQKYGDPVSYTSSAK